MINTAKTIDIEINGQDHAIDAPADMPLLWVIRDMVGLTGSKYSCGKGLCGACTVHVDGVATRSCILPVSAVAGKKITTIEGLSADGDHPLQQAWKKENVAQCGFCQAGQIMNAAGWMKDIPNPTLADVRQHQSGNLCRCGTYTRIRKAIVSAGGMNSTNGGN